jgi:hypothetical protein
MRVSKQESESARADRVAGFGMQETVQPVLIDFGNPEKLDSEFPVLAPSHRSGFDRNWGAQVGSANQDTDG